MKFIQGQDRFQTCLFPVSLDASIDKNNEVRVIDLFVDRLDLNQLGFDVEFVDNGRPVYYPKDLLKLFIYGYLNKIRSSRGLEKESKQGKNRFLLQTWKAGSSSFGESSQRLPITFNLRLMPSTRFLLTMR